MILHKLILCTELYYLLKMIILCLFGCAGRDWDEFFIHPIILGERERETICVFAPVSPTLNR